jgi:hypothetical protein
MFQPGDVTQTMKLLSNKDVAFIGATTMNAELQDIVLRNGRANQELQSAINAARFITPIDNAKAQREQANQRMVSYRQTGYPLDYDKAENRLCYGCTAVAIIITVAIVLHVFASI